MATSVRPNTYTDTQLPTVPGHTEDVHALTENIRLYNAVKLLADRLEYSLIVPKYDSNPTVVEGGFYFNTNTNKLYVCNGTYWEQVTSA
jgi:hypothetical protein